MCLFFRSVDDEKKTASYSLTCESEVRLAHAILEEHKEDDRVRREGGWYILSLLSAAIYIHTVLQ